MRGEEARAGEVRDTVFVCDRHLCPAAHRLATEMRFGQALPGDGERQLSKRWSRFLDHC